MSEHDHHKTGLTVSQYLADPCRAASIPYWKACQVRVPADMAIVHHSRFDPELWAEYHDRTYFRLRHALTDLARPALPQGFSPVEADSPAFADHINRCYADLRVSPEEVEGYRRRQVYCPRLWLALRHDATGQMAATGIGELDAAVGEGVLEWIQVSPEFRGMGLGRFLVLELLGRMQPLADFATVSGRCDDPSDPEKLYRRCGFTGDDVWHILRRKS